MAELAAKLKQLATRVGDELCEGAAKAEKRIMHETRDGLHDNAHAHLENDAKHSETFDKLHPDASGAPKPHDTGSTTPEAAVAGSRTRAIEDPSGGQPFGREPVPGEQHLQSPTTKLSEEDFPYLRRESDDREAEALTGAPRKSPGVPDARPAGHPDIADNADALSTFTGRVKPDHMKAGHTYARTVGHGQYPNGSFWTRSVPNGDAELRGDLAVKNEWNGDHGVVSFTPNHDIPVWSGAAGPQDATGGGGYHLPGGGEQIWVPDGRTPEYSIGPDDGDWSIAPHPAVEQS